MGDSQDPSNPSARQVEQTLADRWTSFLEHGQPDPHALESGQDPPTQPPITASQTMLEFLEQFEPRRVAELAKGQPPPFELFLSRLGPCPYRTTGTWENLEFQAKRMSGEHFQGWLERGFRRSGDTFYRPVCEHCRRCISIRVDTQRFKPNKGQRRTWRKNQDLEVIPGPLIYDRDEFELFKLYQQEWHGDQSVSKAGSPRFLLCNPTPGAIFRYYTKERLVALGFVDLCPNALNSVYFVFDPDESERRMGVFSILYEISYCQAQGMRWLHLGFWVPDSPKMRYKAEYQPAEVLVNGSWMPYQAFDPSAYPQERERPGPLAPGDDFTSWLRLWE
jgi:arginyl-tRNA--protein-N-Asp/Glu arginylyltransferase